MKLHAILEVWLSPWVDKFQVCTLKISLSTTQEMFKKINRALLGAVALASTLAFIPTAQAAMVVQGVVGERIGTSYAAAFTDASYVSGETAEFQMPATLICVDRYASFPYQGDTHTYTVSTTGTATVIHASANSRATDLFNYAVDRFYDNMVLKEVSGSYTGFQFSSLMWELEQDFNGKASSLNALGGEVTASALGLTNGETAYQAMVSDLREHYADIADGYRSTRYTISFLQDQDDYFQSMMALTPLAASEVPEPGTLALSLLAGAALLRRKPRGARRD